MVIHGRVFCWTEVYMAAVDYPRHPCNGCVWSSDTGIGIYCPFPKCIGKRSIIKNTGAEAPKNKTDKEKG